MYSKTVSHYCLNNCTYARINKNAHKCKQIISLLK